MIFFSSGCLEKSPQPYRKPLYPDKDLKEVIIKGYHAPEDKKIKELEKYIRERGLMEEWESFKEKSSPRLLNRWYESFSYMVAMYCYNEKSDKEPVLDKSLKARLYDRKGNLLSENFFRHVPDISREDALHFVYVPNNYVVYIPYNNEGHKILIVSLKEGKEVILKELSFQSQEKLRKESVVVNKPLYSLDRWTFHEKNECHLSPSR